MTIPFLSLLIRSAVAMGIIAVVAFGAGGCRVVDSMAIGTGGTMMINTSTLTATVGVVKCRVPIAGVVTLGTVCAKLAGMDCWFSMTCGAGCG